jgi:hypothetical protein
MKSFSVFEEILSVPLCHLINCNLHFARIVSSVCKVVVENIFLLLKAGRGRAVVADAGGQTFRYTFEGMGWMTTRWHEVQMGARGLVWRLNSISPFVSVSVVSKNVFFEVEISTVSLMEFWK